MPDPKTVPDPKIFSLLSIGQRGVGKTVFLAGSYAQLKNDPLDFDLTALLETDRATRSPERPAFWFECPNQEEQISLEKILNHVQQTGLYPPATIKITDFNFRLKQHTANGTETLCDFKWWDIPGELCDLRNADFQDIVLTSQGCCVFIHAEALLQDDSYIYTLEQVFNQVIAIASLAHQHRLNYAIALILTRYDLLESSTETQLKLQQNLQPLTKHLDDIKANYKHFYSAIPIVSTNGVSRLETKGAADSLLWLLAQLNKPDRLKSEGNLVSSLTQSRPKHSNSLSPRVYRLIVVLTIVSVSLLGIGIALLLGLGLIRVTPNQAPPQEQRTGS